MDKIVLENTILESEPDSSPFLRRDVIKLKDQSSAGNYSSQTSTFETVTLSNNGKWADYRDAIITIPVVIVMTGKTTADAVVDFEASNTDLTLALKNSSINLINSIGIKYGNKNLVQVTDRINDYLVFKQHTELSEQDVAIHGETIGYAKDTGDSWYYNAVNGVCNNNNLSTLKLASNYTEANVGMRERQMKFRNMDNTKASYSSIFNTDDFEKDNQAYIVDTTTYKAYYYNAVLRLRDLPVFDKLGLMKGANFSINLTLNQCTFSFTMSATGAMTFNQSSFSGKLTNPVMVANRSSTNYAFTGDTAPAEVSIPQGTRSLTDGATYTVSVNVAKVLYRAHNSLGVKDCLEKNIELHVPVYELKPSVETRMLEMGQKKIYYNEILSFPKSGLKGSFNELITNGLKSLRRMIILPIISPSENGSGQVDPHLSPFDTCPSTCSPYALENFQVQIANQNVYHNSINYSYELFLQEMNGKYGLESSMFNGESSSMISLRDYVNMYGYIVVDLKRKHTEDDSVPLSVSISGNIVSQKKMDFFIFIEQERSFTYDVTTGTRL